MTDVPEHRCLSLERWVEDVETWSRRQTCESQSPCWLFLKEVRSASPTLLASERVSKLVLYGGYARVRFAAATPSARASISDD